MDKKDMKRYSENEVSSLLSGQRGNSYVAVLTQTRDTKVAMLCCTAPEPGGGTWRDKVGESTLEIDMSIMALIMESDQPKTELFKLWENRNEVNKEI